MLRCSSATPFLIADRRTRGAERRGPGCQAPAPRRHPHLRLNRVELAATGLDQGLHAAEPLAELRVRKDTGDQLLPGSQALDLGLGDDGEERAAGIGEHPPAVLHCIWPFLVGFFEERNQLAALAVFGLEDIPYEDHRSLLQLLLWEMYPCCLTSVTMANSA